MIGVWVHHIDTDENLFVYEAFSPPAVGEEVVYDFAANDQEKWAEEAWVHGKAISGKRYVVVSVTHRVRRNHIGLEGSRYRAVVYVRESE